MLNNKSIVKDFLMQFLLKNHFVIPTESFVVKHAKKILKCVLDIRQGVTFGGSLSPRRLAYNASHTCYWNGFCNSCLSDSRFGVF